MTNSEPEKYSEPCVTLTYSEPEIFRNRDKFRTLSYPQPWHIQKLGILRTLAYSEPEAYSGSCQTGTMEFCENNAIII